jgi:hypothetical protein
MVTRKVTSTLAHFICPFPEWAFDEYLLGGRHWTLGTQQWTREHPCPHGADAPRLTIHPSMYIFLARIVDPILCRPRLYRHTILWLPTWKIQFRGFGFPQLTLRKGGLGLTVRTWNLIPLLLCVQTQTIDLASRASNCSSVNGNHQAYLTGFPWILEEIVDKLSIFLSNWDTVRTQKYQLLIAFYWTNFN